MIAVGGFSLSRGLTLEGLMVSYFLRNSMMYDTLMQMGRWFGYRPGYQDLCRVWLTDEAEGWYAHIAEATEELRTQLRDMQQRGARPRDFALRVRHHPSSLLITARNKMRATGEVAGYVSLSERLIETWALKRSESSLENNRRAARSLMMAIISLAGVPSPVESTRGPHGFLVRSVPVEIVTEFLFAFHNHTTSIFTDTTPVVEFIRQAKAHTATWDVFFPSLQKPTTSRSEPWFGLCGSVPIYPQTRKEVVVERLPPDVVALSSKQRLSSRGIERIGLTDEEVARATQEYKPRRQGGKIHESIDNIPDLAYRRQRTRPLLMVHAVDVVSKDSSLLSKDPVIAWGISFPKVGEENVTTRYAINKVFLNEWYGADDVDDEPEASDA